MTTTDPPSKPKKRTTEEVCKKVSEAVLEQLGKPPDFQRVAVNLYTQGRARANVWCDGKIKDSFYLHLSKTAEIISANPLIKRKY